MSGGRLRAALAEYLAVRRSLGFKLARDGLLLEQFVGFCEQAGASRVTSELALAWVSAPAKASPGWLAMRLTIVRGFASWLQASDPATEVPPLGWLPPRRRTTPYLYSADDVAALVAAARRMRWPLPAATYETFIALLAVTGMRVGEAIRLNRSDLSPGEGLALHPVNIGTIQPGRDSDSPRFFATGIQGAMRLCDERNRREPRRQRDRATERSDGAV